MKLTESEQTELRLDSYLMHVHNTHCTRCDSGERYGQIFEVWVHPTKTRLSGFRELRPARTLLRPDLPIAYVEMPERLLQVCSDCIQTYRSAEDQTPIPAVSAQAWAETLKRKYSPAPAEPKVARRAADAAGIPAPTPDEL